MDTEWAMGGWLDECLDGTWMYGMMHGWMDGQLDGRIDECTDGCIIYG